MVVKGEKWSGGGGVVRRHTAVALQRSFRRVVIVERRLTSAGKAGSAVVVAGVAVSTPCAPNERDRGAKRFVEHEFVSRLRLCKDVKGCVGLVSPTYLKRCLATVCS